MREIDPQDIENGTLSFAEAIYLRDRGRLPADYEMPEDPNDGDEEEPQPVKSRITPLEDQDQIVIGNQGGIDDDDEEETYVEGWNNDQRRAELSRRGLSVEGGKDALIGRLLRSDTGQLQDDDRSTVG